MARTPPRKPSEPLGMIVFRGGDGTSHMVMEPLPNLKEDLELAVVMKFIAAIRTEGTSMDPPTRGDPWPDFETRAGGQRIGIEVVEVINADDARKRSRQLQYIDAVLPLVQDVASVLDGVAITLTDGYQEPLWPAIQSTKGQRLVQYIATKLRADSGDILRGLPEGRFVVHRTWNDFEQSSLHIGITALRGRKPPGSLIAGLDLSFTGTFPCEAASMLSATVRQKIEKAYAPYPEGQLWLLAYTSFYPVIEKEGIARARAVLNGASHPFDAVWGFLPSVGAEWNIAAKVFP